MFTAQAHNQAALLPLPLAKEVIIPRGAEKVLVVDKAQNSTIIVEEGVKLTFILLATEGWEGIPTLSFELRGSNSEVLFLGFMVGSGNDTFQFQTVSRHIASQTKAHYYVRAAMYDESLVDYKGNLIIEKGAQLADTYLAHHTLLLSEKSRARTVPALEIEADDVKAGHAATIGKVDKELMFYLESRGIDEKLAEQLFLSGFFETQLAMITDEKVQARVREDLFQYLPSFNL